MFLNKRFYIVWCFTFSIIQLTLVDFLPICFIFNLFQGQPIWKTTAKFILIFPIIKPNIWKGNSVAQTLPHSLIKRNIFFVLCSTFNIEYIITYFQLNYDFRNIHDPENVHSFYYNVGIVLAITYTMNKIAIIQYGNCISSAK